MLVLIKLVGPDSGEALAGVVDVLVNPVYRIVVGSRGNPGDAGQRGRSQQASRRHLARPATTQQWLE